jgi:hypothetical protein
MCSYLVSEIAANFNIVIEHVTLKAPIKSLKFNASYSVLKYFKT